MTESGAQKQRMIGTTLYEGEKVRGAIIDLPLESARWMTLFKSNGKKSASRLPSAPFSALVPRLSYRIIG